MAGSLAETDFANQSRFAGPWSTEPLAEVTSVGNMLVFAAEDNLRSIAALIEAGSRTLYTRPLGLRDLGPRMVGLRPAIGLEERLCRGGNFILYSHYERRKLEREIGVPETRTPKIDAILDTARQHGLRVTPSKQGSPRWLGNGLRDSTSLCRQMWRVVTGSLYLVARAIVSRTDPDGALCRPAGTSSPR